MNQKRFISFCMVVAVVGLTACNGLSADTETSSGNKASANERGIGKYQHIVLTHPLDESMVARGKNIYQIKCASCHKLTDEKLVGPGFANATNRRSPEWIMNFITNTNEMIEKDAAAQQLLEEHLVLMPNQNLSEEDARAVLEFLRKNDGKN